MNSSSRFLPACLLVLLSQCAAVSAVDFTDQQQQGGKSVYSNIPADCVEDGVLICLQYHPMNQLHFKKSASRADLSTARPQSGRPAVKTGPRASSNPAVTVGPGPTGVNAELNVLQQLIEINQVLDEHFPGNGSDEHRARVKQQQNQLMQLLGAVEQAAGDEARPVIRQAIEIFQSGLAK